MPPVGGHEAPARSGADAVERLDMVYVPSGRPGVSVHWRDRPGAVVEVSVTARFGPAIDTVVARIR